jgi:peptide/nickel transport system substrate-binding protein
MRKLFIFLIVILIGTLTACNGGEPTLLPENLVSPGLPTATETLSTESLIKLTPTETPLPPRVLSICLGLEPSSLFLYGDTTSAAQSVRQAIYDGPFDIYNYEVTPVILEKIPSLADGDAFLRPVEVTPGTLILDTDGNWVALSEGITYRPTGCNQPDCAISYTGEDLVVMDELVAQFRLLPGVEWSDGIPLTARDSVYAYQVLKELYAGVPSELIRYTRQYLAQDELTIEWAGIPGYQSVYEMHFFTPFPQHLWGSLAPAELMTSEISTRTPLGWGPYVIDEWVSGDHISLSRNPNYFRAAEGLPKFDFLVFRFTDTPEAALDALLAGECDFVDRSAALEPLLSRVLELDSQGVLSAAIQSGTAWEQISFGVESIDPARPKFFASKEVRQAVAMCIDRQAISSSSFSGEILIPDTYVPVTHPLRNQDLEALQFDPQKAAELLQLAGWIDMDGDPSTPRVSAGVAGIPDGQPFEVVYLVPDDAERPQVASQIADSLAACGIGTEVSLREWDSLLSPGPEGSIFGRQFDLAQFAWAYSIDPTCSLYTASEIPGPYPEYSKGWGGGNATGYHSAEFDQQCSQAQTSLPDTAQFLDAQQQAQVIFAQDLPALPLYQRPKAVAMRPDMCNLLIDPAFGNALSAIERLDYGDSCK